MSRVEEAVQCFHNGYNCSQAILSTYCEQFGLDKKIALDLSCGMGAGMGRLGGTCGAVTGAYLLIGLACGNQANSDEAAKEKTYALIQEFARKFEKRNKTTVCRELLGVDLIYGDKEKANQRVSEVCSVMVRDAAEITESILEVI